ncbi:hypothetical protein TNCV_1382051 [Trichonephila clavipes]|nr:hypothetical protein TNCV_1382051 [Trichonephila clavipes]
MSSIDSFFFSSLKVKRNQSQYQFIEEVVDLSRQINLEVDSDDVQKLLDSHNQELAMDELIEMHEQDIESLDPVQSEDRIMAPNMEMGSGISLQMRNGIRKWEIVINGNLDQDNGTKLLNYCIVIGSGTIEQNFKLI